MCGICCIFNPGFKTSKGNTLPDLKCILSQSMLEHRGPDCQESINCDLWSQHPAVFAGCVLHLRGSLTPQPLTNSQGDVLLWNGEIFGGLEVSEEQNDAQVLFDYLTKCKSDQEILTTLQSVQGPWALIFWQANQDTLWFGRDVFGRRSLLWHLPTEENGYFAMSSIPIQFNSTAMAYKEIPSVGLFSVKAAESRPDKDNQLLLNLYPWQGAKWPSTDEIVACGSSESLAERLCLNQNHFINVKLQSYLTMSSWMPNINGTIPCEEQLFSLDNIELKTNQTDEKHDLLKTLQTIKSTGKFDLFVKQLMDVLQKAVMKRVYNLPRRATQTQSVSECTDQKQQTTISQHSMESCSSNSEAQDDFRSVGSVNEDISNLCVEDPAKQGEANDTADPARVAVLFSGGIDSTVLAALADRCVPEGESIDLINVAFEQKTNNAPLNKKKERPEGEKSSSYNVPDRVTGYSALAELNSSRHWNFVEVNVTQDMLQEQRSKFVRHLVYPLNTVLDDSIGCAVWFAAGGQGIFGNGASQGKEYRSSAKVIICGMGADEQLGGYSRHRNCFQRGSWPGLISEINMEIHRISERNLGRDDRVITDHGKEARFPFLDEDVVSFLASLPIQLKADLRLPRGIGEKLLLRLLALQLGLPTTASLPKRAIQFGSRIAKLEQRKEKGGQACSRLAQE